jgi:hypothetical protein
MEDRESRIEEGFDEPGFDFSPNGWPHILASLKSLLETGEPLEEPRRWPKGH